jgi:hypothetical protein
MTNILRVLVVAVAASLFFAWVAPALAQSSPSSTLLIQSDARTIHAWRASRLFPHRNVT